MMSFKGVLAMNSAGKTGMWALFAVLLALCPISVLRAQDSGTIRGRVVDSTTQQPIAGAQVQVTGSNRGVTTDASGGYVLRGVPVGPTTIRVQHIGFGQRTQEINVLAGSTTGQDSILQPIATTLSRVVVVGYGSRSRAEVTGALTTVPAGDVVGTPIAGVDAMLQGKAAGVQVTQNAGNPGNGISVRIRGSASLSASNQPLYVVDGVPVQQDDFSQLGYSGQNI